MSTHERRLPNEDLEALVHEHGAATPVGRALRELQERRLAPATNEATEMSDVEKRDLPGTDEA